MRGRGNALIVHAHAAGTEGLRDMREQAGAIGADECELRACAAIALAEFDPQGHVEMLLLP